MTTPALVVAGDKYTSPAAETTDEDPSG